MSTTRSLRSDQRGGSNSDGLVYPTVFSLLRHDPTKQPYGSRPEGSVFLLPKTRQRDLCLLNTVRYALHVDQQERIVDDEPLENESTLEGWILVTTAEKEANWYTLLNKYTTVFKNATHTTSDGSARRDIPRCALLLTYDRLGILDWFAQRDTTKKLLVVFDEAHNVTTALRTSLTLTNTLKGFGRLHYYTYNLYLSQLGLLLKTFDVKASTHKDIHDCIQAFPTDDNDFKQQFGQHHVIKSFMQLGTHASLGMIINFASVLFIINNLQKYFPSIWTSLNQTSDDLKNPSASNDLRAYFDKRRRAARTTKHKRDRRGVRTTRRHRRRGGKQSVRGGQRAVSRWSTPLTLRKKGGNGLFTRESFSTIIFFTILGYIPGAPEWFGKTFYKGASGAANTFASEASKHIKIPFSDYLSKFTANVSKHSKALAKHIPAQWLDVNGWFKLVHRTIQVLAKEVFHIPHEQRGAVMAFMSLWASLQMARMFMKYLWRHPLYVLPTKTVRILKQYVCCKALTAPQHKTRVANLSEWGQFKESIHRVAPTIPESIRPFKENEIRIVHMALSSEQTEKAIQWSLHARRSTDHINLRKGLHIPYEPMGSFDAHPRVKRIQTLVQRASSNKRRILLYTQYNDVAEALSRLNTQIHHITHERLKKATPFTPSSSLVICLDAETCPGKDQIDTIAPRNKLGALAWNLHEVHYLEPCSTTEKAHVRDLFGVSSMSTTDSLMINLPIGYGLGGDQQLSMQVNSAVAQYEYISKTSLLPNKISWFRHLVKEIETPDQIVLSQQSRTTFDLYQLETIMYEPFKGDMGSQSLRLSQPLMQNTIPSRKLKFQAMINKVKDIYETRSYDLIKEVQNLSDDEKLQKSLLHTYLLKENRLAKQIAKHMGK